MSLVKKQTPYAAVPAVVCSFLAAAGCAEPPASSAKPETAAAAAGGKPASQLLDPREKHIANLRQLTFGGENAEAYFSFDGTRLVYQSTEGGLPCDQIFVMNVDGSGKARVSTGAGRTTCSYFLPGDQRVLYSSTHLADAACPPKPDFSKGYVWAIDPGYDVFTANADGTDLHRMTATPGYDAEATVSPDGKSIVFTSTRDGDLELYAMDVDGSNVRRLTDVVGYDGGAFYSPDSQMLCYRAHHPTDPQAIARYRDLLKEGLIEPRALEIFVMKADGSGARAVTSNGAANFCPFFTPDGKKIVFSSNQGDPKGREFDLFLVDIASGAVEQVTFAAQFDGFPMFSPDGKRFVFASNRGGAGHGETNIFIADWVD